MTSTLCFCGSPLNYADCCQPLHLGTSKAASAEQLMRSRYSAFCLQLKEYLTATHHPQFRSPQEYEALTKTDWKGLKIIASGKDTVEFVAFYSDGGIQQIHEKSNFVFENEQWFYTNGQHLSAIKLGRNDPCICGSGLKFKKCCG